MLPKLKQKKENLKRQKVQELKARSSLAQAKMGAGNGGPSVGNLFEYNIYGLE